MVPGSKGCFFGLLCSSRENYTRSNPIPQTMANPGFFQVPVDDVRRAKKFYQSLPGWKIEPASLERTQGAHPAL
jgi:hypothetical protein